MDPKLAKMFKRGLKKKVTKFKTEIVQQNIESAHIDAAVYVANELPDDDHLPDIFEAHKEQHLQHMKSLRDERNIERNLGKKKNIKIHHETEMDRVNNLDTDQTKTNMIS